MENQIRKIEINNQNGETKVIPAAISQIYWGDDMDLSGKHNLNIVTEDTDKINGKNGKINLESASDIQFKPVDDISFISSHRNTLNLNEISMKVLNGDDEPVQLKLNASEVVLSSKDKTGAHPETFDVTVNKGKSTRGYLKVRAQAIDLRCEDHGGIALQPKGEDSDGHENKIKFEHNGGDGLEFGTFNTKHTSIFTDDYRFNKNGKIYAVTRQAPVTTNGKTDYPTQADDFKDVINEDLACTWENLVYAVKWVLSNSETINKLFAWAAELGFDPSHNLPSGPDFDEETQFVASY